MSSFNASNDDFFYDDITFCNFENDNFIEQDMLKVNSENDPEDQVEDQVEDDAEDDAEDEAKDEAEDDAEDEAEDEAEHKNLFTGIINRETAKDIVSDFLLKKLIAPTFTQFSEIYQNRERKQKQTLYKERKCNYSFQRFCTFQRLKYRRMFEAKHKDISFKKYRKKCTAEKHRILVNIFIEQLRQEINANVTRV